MDLKGERHLQVTEFDERQAHTRNVPDGDVEKVVDELLDAGYGSWHVETTTETLRLRYTKKGKELLHRQDDAREQETSHDRVKQRVLDPAAPFLIELGISDHQGRVKPSRQAKYKQIEEFCKLLAPAIDEAVAAGRIAAVSGSPGGVERASEGVGGEVGEREGSGASERQAEDGSQRQAEGGSERQAEGGERRSERSSGEAEAHECEGAGGSERQVGGGGERQGGGGGGREVAGGGEGRAGGRLGRVLEVVDLGCGNAYLTLAAYHLLTERGYGVRMTGIDQNPAARTRNTRVVEALGWEGQLRFLDATIQGAELDVQPDVVLALHACDTATDDALARAVGWGAALVLAAPCCHHDIQKQLKSVTPPAPYALMTRYGIVRERFADVLTDSLRAAVLRQVGYRVEVVQFVDSQHTPRNLLLRAARTGAKPTAELRAEYQAMVTEWQVTPRLAQLLLPRGAEVVS
ncbi:class I SAM-dependent methyltransferase [Kribbella sp. NPDC004536]|uniref:class I SAM-dependent methyltransferase n=1 Tax=Kribbella sp. NPDC004536 TaxID=3364106 RepID=UPI003679584C